LLDSIDILFVSYFTGYLDKQ